MNSLKTVDDHKIPSLGAYQRKRWAKTEPAVDIAYVNGSESTNYDTTSKKKKGRGVSLGAFFQRAKVSNTIVCCIAAAVLIAASRHFKRSHEIEISIILLTYSKYEKLANLLSSVLFQRPSNFEIILVDNGCKPETREVLDDILFSQNAIPYKFLQLCPNPGHAAGNNKGVKLASPTSTHLLFLNDDIVMLSKSTFIHNLLDLAKAKETSGAVGCKLLNARGEELIEAGSIIWADASATRFGRGRRDIDAPEFSFARPVDYVSGACLLVDKKLFEDYGGFDGKNFPNYEDTDLQLHIQHDLHKEVWFQSKSVALYAEHGSFRNEKSENVIQEEAEWFKKKWGEYLTGQHVMPPFQLEEKEQGRDIFRAADLRARDPKKANILYIEDKTPNKSKGSGYGRSFDNLSMIAELGHRVTLITWLPRDGWCDDECVDEITSLGIEYVDRGSWDWLVQSRIGYYDIVIVSRPSTFRATYMKWQEFYKQSSFSLVYDAEALWFRRSELQYKVVQTMGIDFPSYDPETKPEVIELILKTDELTEVSLVRMADTVLTVSEREKEQIGKLLPPGKYDIEVIGHAMTPAKKEGKVKFKERKGMLFLASFSDSMFYNGDAIWYFLAYTYKHIVESSSKPTPLTIVGREIPFELKNFVKSNRKMHKFVTFLESPPTVDSLFENSRMLIAPHLYGAGIQYKVSEALAQGLPVVMSPFTKDSFDNGVPGCVGSDIESYKKCIEDLDGNVTKWEALRDEGISYIERTHSRQKAMERWGRVIDSNKLALLEPTKKCDEGEKIYLSAEENRDIAYAVKAGIFESGFQHWDLHGKHEGRKYYCNSNRKFHNLLHYKIPVPTKKCDEGEEIYLSAYEDIEVALKGGIFESAFQHWDLHGKQEGRSYYCNYVFQAAADTEAEQTEEQAAKN